MSRKCEIVNNGRHRVLLLVEFIDIKQLATCGNLCRHTSIKSIGVSITFLIATRVATKEMDEETL